MQRKILLDLLSLDRIVPMARLEQELNLSSRSIRTVLTELKADGKRHGFDVDTLRNQGYSLRILDKTKYDAYRDEDDDYDYIGGAQMRIPRILYFLLQQNDYFTVQKIADLLGVSRNTVLNDLDALKEYIVEQNLGLTLESKSHYGVKVSGNEHALRKAVSRYVVNSQGYISVTKNYFKFTQELDISALEAFLKTEFDKEHLNISQKSFVSIVDHLRVLLFRSKQGNFINEMTQGQQKISDVFLRVATEIVQWMEEHFNLKLPDIETIYLASQLAGKASAESIPDQDKLKLEKEIHRILVEIDREYITSFNKDKILLDALLMHMYPLLTRIAHKIELDNPLVDLVSSRYANVFLVALRFVELWNENEVADLSRDEVGYLALHFAANMERKKNDAINSFTRILIISEIGRGNVMMIKHKLENAFKNATISYDNLESPEEINQTGAHLILSTLELDQSKIDCPVIYIREMIDDNDISEIKDLLVIKANINYQLKKDEVVQNLFDERLFELTVSGKYIDSIESMSHKMVDLGIAHETFPSLVLERELRFTTVYENGVAGPHSMVLNGIEEKLGVIIPQSEMVYLGKEVNIIFLINIRKGNLFLYREVSRFVQALINHPNLVKELNKIKNYHDFENFVVSLKY